MRGPVVLVSMLLCIAVPPSAASTGDPAQPLPSDNPSCADLTWALCLLGSVLSRVDKISVCFFSDCSDGAAPAGIRPPSGEPGSLRPVSG